VSAAGFELEVESLRRALRARGHELESRERPAASEAEIRACELAIRRSLPEAYRAVLRAYNGLALTLDPKPGSEPDLILYGTDDVIEEHERFGRLYRSVKPDGESMGRAGLASEAPHFWDNLIAFANYGVGVCVFDVSPDAPGGHIVRDLDLDDLHTTREAVLAASFDGWVAKAFAAAVEEQSFVYWLPGERTRG
jgi:SMI1 / KNR4 family (SUKH-1)